VLKRRIFSYSRAMSLENTPKKPSPVDMLAQSRGSLLAEGSSSHFLGLEIKSGIECMTLKVDFPVG
jgi:hypothetical protein